MSGNYYQLKLIVDRRFWCSLIILMSVAEIADAQYHSFGRNKVQYTDFEWQVLSTDHFDIYYDPDMEELALIGANTPRNRTNSCKINTITP